MMEALSNPYLLFIIILLSLISTWFCWAAMKEKNPAALLLGIGTGLPTIGVTDWRYWVAGVAVCGAGWWVRNLLS